MCAVSDARDLIKREPSSWRSHVLQRLLDDLTQDRPIQTRDIYSLPPEDFRLAVGCLHAARVVPRPGGRSIFI